MLQNGRENVACGGHAAVAVVVEVEVGKWNLGVKHGVVHQGMQLWFRLIYANHNNLHGLLTRAY